MAAKTKIAEKLVMFEPFWWIYQKISGHRLKKDLREVVKLSGEYADLMENDGLRDEAQKLRDNISDLNDRMKKIK